MTNHVTSLALSKRLKELGVEQKSEFYWVKLGSAFDLVYGKSIYSSSLPEGAISAFLSSELGEMIGSGFDLYCKDGKWIIQGGMGPTELRHEGSSESEARGLLLVYLLEQKLITV